MSTTHTNKTHRHTNKIITTKNLKHTKKEDNQKTCFVFALKRKTTTQQHTTKQKKRYVRQAGHSFD